MDKTVEEAIKELTSNIDAAYNAGDATKMASYWAEGGLNVSPFGDAFEGRASIEADLRGGLEGFMKGSTHELAVSKVRAINDQVAVADGVATIAGLPGMGPMTSDFSMICAKDEDGNWHVAQLRAYKFLPKQG